MPTTEMIVAVAVAAAAVLTIVHLLRLVGTLVVHATIRKAIDRNPEGAGAMLERLTATPADRSDDRTGLLLIAVGMAMVIGSVIINDPAWLHYAVAAALFPLLMGSVLWLRHVWARRTRGQ